MVIVEIIVEEGTLVEGGNGGVNEEGNCRVLGMTPIVCVFVAMVGIMTSVGCMVSIW